MKEYSNHRWPDRVIFGLGGSFLVIWVALVAYSYKANADRDTQLTDAKQFGEFLAQSHGARPDTTRRPKGLAQGLVEVTKQNIRIGEVAVPAGYSPA